jgi:DNA-binding transcriptional LysR family regulator
MLMISQPAISLGMQELECQFGAALLDRSRRIETPIEVSIVLHRYFQRLFAEERAAEQPLAGLPSLEQGRRDRRQHHTHRRKERRWSNKQSRIPTLTI